jgi:hypothetical protein
MNENEPHVWDEASVAHSFSEMMKRVEKMTEGMFTVADLPSIQTDPSPTHVFAKYLPDGKTWTEQELLAELERLP